MPTISGAADERTSVTVGRGENAFTAIYRVVGCFVFCFCLRIVGIIGVTPVLSSTQEHKRIYTTEEFGEEDRELRTGILH